MEVFSDEAYVGELLLSENVTSFTALLDLPPTQAEQLLRTPEIGKSSVSPEFDTPLPDLDHIEDEKPRVGMEFDNLENAWNFWKRYGKSVGFGVRINYQNRCKKDNVITSAVYVCCKQGKRLEDKRRTHSVHRWEVRSQCQVKINIVFDRKLKKYKIKFFVEEHNHELEPPETRHMLRSCREVSGSYALAIDLASDSGLTPRATHELLCKEAGGRAKLGFIMEDQMSYLRSRREKSMAYGELGNIVRYFEEQKMRDPGFFYSMQFDRDELVTNIYWADSKMIVDYIDFGDVVTFDTTYGTNKELRPLGAFVGLNHHRQMVIFGGALMYDETIDSFAWLFETFLKAHGGKMPQTIFTDQDAAMTNALQRVWPNTRHGLCTWHLNQNGIKHLGWRMKEGSTFLTDFQKCMFEYTEEIEFENEWSNLLEKYSLRDNEWLLRLYSLKEKWARCYMKYAFTLGIRSTQLSESLNSDLKDYLKCDLNIIDFFKNFDRVVEQKRENELKAEFKARQRIPLVEFSDSPLLQQASERYTPHIFELFQTQLRRALRVIFKTKDETRIPHEYVVCLRDLKDKEFKVSCDPNKELISCTCRKFERMGILCNHALKIFITLDIMDIPENYILPRWTRGFKSAHILTKKGQDVKEDANQWVRRIQSQILRMTFQASTHEVTRNSVEKMMMNCNKEVIDFATKNVVVDKENVVVNVDDAMGNLKGLKKKNKGLRRTKRPKPLHEVNLGKSRRRKLSSSKLASTLISQPQSNEVDMSSQFLSSQQNSQPSHAISHPWSNVLYHPNMSFQYLNHTQHDQHLDTINHPLLNVVCEARMPLQTLNPQLYGPSHGSLQSGP